MRTPIKIASLVLLLLAGRAWADVAEKKTFTAVVEEHFAAWDRDHDSKLSVAEVNAALLNPRVTGNEAAAVAALHVYLRQHKDPAPLTKAFLLSSTKGKEAEERRDVERKQAHFSSDYASYCSHLRKAPRDVFATKESPGLVGFAQGNLGDCYFLASVAAGLHADPVAFRRMFVAHSDGSCDVHFYSGHAVRLPRLTDAEIVLGSSAGTQGLWLNVAEKAFGEVKIQLRKARPSSRDTIDLDVISHGGYPTEAIEVLCGTKARTLSIRKGKGNEPPAAHQIPALQTELHQLFSTALPRRFLCCCGVASAHAASKYPPGIVTDHAYAVLGYDPRTQQVTVMNPWGNHFEPKGAPGLLHGYETKNGMFTLSLADFIHVFEEVYYQTAMPAKR
jgi:hypothetical protein